MKKVILLLVVTFSFAFISLGTPQKVSDVFLGLSLAAKGSSQRAQIALSATGLYTGAVTEYALSFALEEAAVGATVGGLVGAGVGLAVGL